MAKSPLQAKDQASFNAKFSGVATAAATVIGAVAQLVIARRARHEIEQSVKDSNKQIAELIALIADDAQGSFLRQQSQLGAYGVQLYKDYSCEISAPAREFRSRRSSVPDKGKRSSGGSGDAPDAR